MRESFTPDFSYKPESLSRPDELIESGLDALREEQRQEFLGQFERHNDTEGLDVTRVNYFLVEHHLPVSASLVLDKRLKPQVEAAIRPWHADKDFSLKAIHGIAEHFPSVIILFRDKELEEINGPLYTEGLLLHELAHLATAQLESSYSEQGHASHTRRGFVTTTPEGKTRGAFFEEGMADCLRGQYTRAVTGSVNGLYTEIAEPAFMGIPIGGHTLHVPVAYAHREKGDDYGHFPAASVAAAGLELLVARDPSLWPTMLDARFNDQDLQLMEGKVNAISPGLYEQLASYEASLDGVKKSALPILDALEDGPH